MSILFLSANVCLDRSEGECDDEPSTPPTQTKCVSPRAHLGSLITDGGKVLSTLHAHTHECGPKMQAMGPRGWTSSHMCRLPPHNCHGHVGVLPMWPWGHIVGSLVAKTWGVCGYQKPAPLHYLHGVPTIIIFTRFLGTRFFDQIQPVHHTYYD